MSFKLGYLLAHFQTLHVQRKKARWEETGSPLLIAAVATILRLRGTQSYQAFALAFAFSILAIFIRF